MIRRAMGHGQIRREAGESCTGLLQYPAAIFGERAILSRILHTSPNGAEESVCLSITFLQGEGIKAV